MTNLRGAALIGAPTVVLVYCFLLGVRDLENGVPFRWDCVPLWGSLAAAWAVVLAACHVADANNAAERREQAAREARTATMAVTPDERAVVEAMRRGV